MILNGKLTPAYQAIDPEFLSPDGEGANHHGVKIEALYEHPEEVCEGQVHKRQLLQTTQKPSRNIHGNKNSV